MVIAGIRDDLTDISRTLSCKALLF